MTRCATCLGLACLLSLSGGCWTRWAVDIAAEEASRERSGQAIEFARQLGPLLPVTMLMDGLTLPCQVCLLMIFPTEFLTCLVLGPNWKKRR